jgi:hypothetical protein
VSQLPVTVTQPAQLWKCQSLPSLQRQSPHAHSLWIFNNRRRTASTTVITAYMSYSVSTASSSDIPLIFIATADDEHSVDQTAPDPHIFHASLSSAASERLPIAPHHSSRITLAYTLCQVHQERQTQLEFQPASV